MTETGFAAAIRFKGKTFVDLHTIRHRARDVRQQFSDDRGGWPGAMKRGWFMTKVKIEPMEKDDA